MRNDLSAILGSLARVQIVSRSSHASALGKFRDETMIVTHAEDYVGRECSVKFDSNPRAQERGLIGNFISFEFPDESDFIPNDRYVLCALWEDRMKKNLRYPNIEEINKYYDPGNLRVAYYINNQFSSKKKAQIYRGGYHILEITIAKAIKSLIVLSRARLLIAESEEKLKRLTESVAAKGLIPVVMDPLR